MPKYSYRCSHCCKEFEIYHSMFEEITKCDCGSDNIERIPSLSFSVSNHDKAGKLVKEFIENTKQDIKAEKQKLKEEYND